MGLFSWLWNAATWAWNTLEEIAPNVTNAVSNAVTTVVDTIVNAVQNNGSQPNTPTQPTGPTLEEIRQERINRGANQFDRDIGRTMRPELEEDARFYDEYPSDNLVGSPASMADMLLLAGQNSIVYDLLQMMRNEQQTLNIVMQHANSTLDGLRLLFADACHNEADALEAASLWEQYRSGGGDVVVANVPWFFQDQEDPTPTAPLQGPLGPNGEYFFSNEQIEIEPGSYIINTQRGLLVLTSRGELDVASSAEALEAAGISVGDLPPRIRLYDHNPSPSRLDQLLDQTGISQGSPWTTMASATRFLTEFSGDVTDNGFQLSLALPRAYQNWDSPQSAWMARLDNDNQSGNINMRVWDNLEPEIARRYRMYVDSNDSLYVEPPIAFTSTLESTLDVSRPGGTRFNTTTGRKRSVSGNPAWGTPSVPGITVLNPLIIVSTLAAPVYEVDSYNGGNMGFVNQPIGLGGGKPVQWGNAGETDPNILETFFSSPTADNVTYDVLLNINIESRASEGLPANSGTLYEDSEYRAVITTEQYATVAGYNPTLPFLQDYLIESYLSVGNNGLEFQGMQTKPENSLREEG